jgi:mannose-6-phosphate isomerase
MSEECIVFKPLYQERVWGGRILESLYGRTLPPKIPIGESWELVDRLEAQSIVAAGRFADRSVHELWTNHREEIFGTTSSSERFPILIKIIDAADPLSVQVHPPAEIAPLFGGEPKTEIWYFTSTGQGAIVYAGLKKGTTRSDFEEALANGTVADLLHQIPTKEDAYLFIPSGRLHAIDTGNVIFEIQQNSDSTFRVFDWNRVGLDGNPRKLHLAESLQSIDFDDFEPVLSYPSGEAIASNDCFTVERWELKESRRANDSREFSVFQVVRGEISFQQRSFGPGDLFLAPASAHAVPVVPESSAPLILRTTLPAPKATAK